MLTELSSLAAFYFATSGCATIKLLLRRARAPALTPSAIALCLR